MILCMMHDKIHDMVHGMIHEYDMRHEIYFSPTAGMRLPGT